MWGGRMLGGCCRGYLRPKNEPILPNTGFGSTGAAAGTAAGAAADMDSGGYDGGTESFTGFIFSLFPRILFIILPALSLTCPAKLPKRPATAPTN